MEHRKKKFNGKMRRWGEPAQKKNFNEPRAHEERSEGRDRGERAHKHEARPFQRDRNNRPNGERRYDRPSRDERRFKQPEERQARFGREDRKNRDRGERRFDRRDDRRDGRSPHAKESEPKPVKVFEPGKPIQQKRFSIAAQGATQTQAASEPQNLGSFSDFTLPEPLSRAIADAGFTTPTPIQAKSLPFTLQGQDLIGCAQTGTGKTAAFAIPMIAHLLANPDSCALILAPTRELAAQIVDTIRKLTAHTRDIRNTVIVGGASFGDQVRSLRQGPRIVVATPGRLVDHLQRETIRLDDVSFFVLDEADRMFDMGFTQQIDKIVEHIPESRQTLLFSATFSKEVKRLALNSLRNPKEIFIGAPSSPAAGVDQVIVETQSKDKFNLLLEELNGREGSVLIFSGMKHRADRLADNLESYGHSVAIIHGDRSMGQRKSALAGFRAQKVRILVATDIAARGIDISHVAHVINYDLPRDPEDYIHRIGRTARAGAKGQALSFVTPEERGAWKKIERLLPRPQRAK